MCTSCEVLFINGVKCHEFGCPDAWRDEKRDCKNCGCEFNPESREQMFCDDSCYRQYYGYPEPEEEETCEPSQ